MRRGAEAVLAGYLDQLTTRAAVQPLRGRALPAAGERPARLYRPADACALPAPRRATSSATSPCSACPLTPTSSSRTAARTRSGRGAGCFAAQVFGLTGLGDRTIALALQHGRPQGAADGPGRARHAPRDRGPEPVGLLHLRLGQADHSPTPTCLPAPCSSNAELGYPFVRRQAETVRGSVGHRRHQPDGRGRPRRLQPRPPPGRLRAARHRRGREPITPTPAIQPRCRRGIFSRRSSCGRA